MNELFIKVGKVAVTYVLCEMVGYTIDKAFGFCKDRKFKRDLERGKYVEIDGKYYKVTIEEA